MRCVLPNYNFLCKKCNEIFDEICSIADLEAKFPKVRCPKCNGKSLTKNVIGTPPGAAFSNPRESSKWDNFTYRAGKTAEEAKMQRAVTESLNGKGNYRNYDDTNNGRRMNFID